MFITQLPLLHNQLLYLILIYIIIEIIYLVYFS